MKILEDAEPVCLTDDIWYMLTAGGYIKPEKFVSPEDAKAVRDAIKVIKEFERTLNDNDLLEIM